MQTLKEAMLEAFQYLENTYNPKWTSGKGSKEKLIDAFSQNELPKHEFLGFAGSDGLRHAFGRALTGHNKPKSTKWEIWLLRNINKFQCTKCNLVHAYNHKYDTNVNLCKDCNSIKCSDTRDSKRQYVYDVLSSSSGCVDCGEKDPIVLEFDHRDPSTKSSNIGDSYGKSIEYLKEEILKCDIVCANCHRKRTAKMFNYYKYVKQLSNLP
jgi:hypothetical protein